jgi:hypothetical protein
MGGQTRIVCEGCVAGNAGALLMNDQDLCVSAEVRCDLEGLPARAASFPTSRQRRARYGAPGFVARYGMADGPLRASPWNSGRERQIIPFR